MKTFSIITPCYNAEKYIEETVKSVILQTAVINKEVKLEYIICDGGSSDETLNVIRDVFKKYNYEDSIIISEPDNGMYDALVKGLKKTTGDFCAYINAGDIYSSHAFEIIEEVFKNASISWVTGLRVMYNEKSQIVSAELPLYYDRSLIATGYYGRFMPYIQQESTFWRKELNKTIDLNRLVRLRYAGDYLLWYSFAKKSELFIIEAYLCGFKKHKGQLSESIGKYKDEIKSFRNKLKLINYVKLPLNIVAWVFSSGFLRRKLNRKTMILYNHQDQAWEYPGSYIK